MSFVRVDGLKIRVSQTGTGSGYPLLMINGLGACLESWQPLARQLGRRKLIMVDHPGTGLSQSPDRIIGMRELAGLYVSILDRLGLERVDVLGFSFGGSVAQQLAHDHPERVNSMILAATSCGWGGAPADPMISMFASSPLRYQVPVLRQMAAPFIYRGRAGRHPQLFETELKGLSRHRASMRGVFYQVAAYATWSSIPWLRSLRVPTLVLAGSQDPMAPVANSRLLAASIRGAELAVFDEGGHLFLSDQAADVAPVISGFLDRVEVTAV